MGDTVKVKVIHVDDTGRIKLSRKALLEPEEGDDNADNGGRKRRRGKKNEDAVEAAS